MKVPTSCFQTQPKTRTSPVRVCESTDQRIVSVLSASQLQQAVLPLSTVDNSSFSPTRLTTYLVPVLAPWHIRSKNSSFSKNGCAKEPAQVEKNEPLRRVAAAYGVSHETIRRVVRAARCGYKASVRTDMPSSQHMYFPRVSKKDLT